MKSSPKRVSLVRRSLCDSAFLSFCLEPNPRGWWKWDRLEICHSATHIFSSYLLQGNDFLNCISKVRLCPLVIRQMLSSRRKKSAKKDGKWAMLRAGERAALSFRAVNSLPRPHEMGVSIDDVLTGSKKMPCFIQVLLSKDMW